MRSALLILSTCLLLLACKKEAPAPLAGDAVEAKGAALYQLKITPASPKPGEAAESLIEIQPGAGYKINQEFPSRLQLKPVEGLSYAKDTLALSDAEISDKALRFKVSHTAQAAGDFEIPAIADFSVCNPQTCQLFRGEALSWKITAR
ncbi:hypothetical protein KKF91_15970 [Myxococcota bacterium]|nr:hypothetical protein [Myxococcota bacterium]MBU1432039.1 hypothetical protein [Myxococcota bacterium]MBU1899023.1 hypothetical protein [Myxococcota bacterium]